MIVAPTQKPRLATSLRRRWFASPDLAAVLVAVVVTPGLLGFAPTPSIRQVCAWAALVLMVGCAAGLVSWIHAVLAGRTGFNL